MIVNYRIVKLRHGDIGDIERLDTFFRRADVVSIEAGGLSEEGAAQAESTHKLLCDLTKRERESLQKSLVQDAKKYGVEANWAVAWWFAIRQAKPLVFYERYTAENSKTIISKLESSKILGLQLSQHLLNGDLETSLGILQRATELYNEATTLRDERIPSIAANIGEKIIQLYPHLQDRNQITYLMPIGADHNFESGLVKLVTSKVEVVPIQYQSVASSWYGILAKRMLKEGGLFETYIDDAARVLLSAAVAYALPPVKPTPTLAHHISYLAVKDMGYGELQELCARLKRASAEPFIKFPPHKIINQFFVEKGIRLPQNTRQYLETFKRLREN